jgi:hypothetical protein
MIWVGLDLHQRYVTACALDDGGAAVAERGRLPTDVAALLAWLGELGGPVTVAMEATLYWAWLHDRLTNWLGNLGSPNTHWLSPHWPLRHLLARKASRSTHFSVACGLRGDALHQT